MGTIIVSDDSESIVDTFPGSRREFTELRDQLPEGWNVVFIKENEDG